MPKPLKKKTKRPADPVLAAQELLAETEALAEKSGEPAEVVDFKAHLSAYMKKLGKKGGKASGKRRMTNLTQEQRSTIALKAARTRWAKAKKAKKATKLQRP